MGRLYLARPPISLWPNIKPSSCLTFRPRTRRLWRGRFPHGVRCRARVEETPNQPRSNPMTLDEAKKEVAANAESGLDAATIEQIAKLYRLQVSDARATMTEEEWKARNAAIKSDLLHELLLTH